MAINRTLLTDLNEWLISKARKPLVLRGARQVGKTWLVREFAQKNNRKLIELNFEKQANIISLFESNSPQQILLNLSAFLKQTIESKNCILFLDEIQAAPALLAKLRWFAEDMPELPVIAAGSLLDFVLAEHTFSMPVGRITYMHLEPLSFEEFLSAYNGTLADYIHSYQWNQQIPDALHQELLRIFKEYILIGGMPQAAANWLHQRSLTEINRIHHDLLATYRDDFAKYRGRIDIERLQEVMAAIPVFLGRKFIYSKVNPDIQIPSIKRALDLLFKARVCSKVAGCAANGIPLSAEIQDKYMKAIFLDVGLCSALLGLTLDQLNHVQEINLINMGSIAEQVVGQILRTIFPSYIEPALYYWHREEKGSNAEIDYIVQHRNQVIPIEVKAGSTGGLKSLHLFMGLKQYTTAVRINSDNPSQTSIQVKDHQGNLIQYVLYSIPFYLLGRLHHILK